MEGYTNGSYTGPQAIAEHHTLHMQSAKQNHAHHLARAFRRAQARGDCTSFSRVEQGTVSRHVLQEIVVLAQRAKRRQPLIRLPTHAAVPSSQSGSVSHPKTQFCPVSASLQLENKCPRGNGGGIITNVKAQWNASYTSVQRPLPSNHVPGERAMCQVNGPCAR
jgi:hypothetical protein